MTGYVSAMRTRANERIIEQNREIEKLNQLILDGRYGAQCRLIPMKEPLSAPSMGHERKYVQDLETTQARNALRRRCSERMM